MRKTINKGFTLIELIIVIAVIAILAGVLIPTYIALVEKAQISSDTQLVRNLNTALAIDNQEHDTMSSALQAAKECGFDVVKINATKQNNEILWDSVNDVFCYYNDETEQIEYIPNSINGTALAKNDYRLWKISDEVDENYSTYLYNCVETTINTSKGLDVGNCTSIPTINYVNTTGNAQNVVIKTLGGTLTVNAPNDTINHFGNAAFVDIIAVDNNSYIANGSIGFVQVALGHALFTNTSFIGGIHIANDNAIVEVLENAVVDRITMSAEITLAIITVNNISYIVPNEDIITADAAMKNSMIIEINNEDQLASFFSGEYKNGALVKDFTATNFVVPTSVCDKILDLNNHTITLENSGYYNYVRSNLTIKDSGENGTVKDNDFGISPRAGATLTIESGRFESVEDSYYLFYNMQGTIVINGGSFYSKNALFNNHNTMLGSVLTINGGTFEVGSNIDNSTGETYYDPIIYAGKDVVVTINGGTFKYGDEFILYYDVNDDVYNYDKDGNTTITLNGGDYYKNGVKVSTPQ